jgi:hypothetical protein
MNEIKPSLFISYSWDDGNIYADELETQLKDYFEVKRDKSQLIANDDLYDFMAEIANCDNVVIVLTQAYVRSVNCMLEMSYLLKQPDWLSKAVVLVIDESLYKTEKKLEIITYWLLRKKKVHSDLESEELGLKIIQEEKEIIDDICDNVEDFFLGISRRKNPTQIAVVNEIIKKSRKCKVEEKTLISEREQSVIKVLEENPKASLQDISRELNFSKAFTCRLLKGLEQKGRMEVIFIDGKKRYNPL